MNYYYIDNWESRTIHQPNPKSEAIRKLVGDLRRLLRAIYVDSARISRRYGLTSPQSAVLRTLYKNGPLSSADLSRHLFVTPSNMTGVIDRLVKKALVERVPRAGDRRVLQITLTSKGSALSRVLPDPIEKKLIAGLADMQAEQVRLFSDLTHRILALIAADRLIDSPLEFPQNDTDAREP